MKVIISHYSGSTYWRVEDSQGNGLAQAAQVYTNTADATKDIQLLQKWLPSAPVVEIASMAEEQPFVEGKMGEWTLFDRGIDGITVGDFLKKHWMAVGLCGLGLYLVCKIK